MCWNNGYESFKDESAAEDTKNGRKMQIWRLLHLQQIKKQAAKTKKDALRPISIRVFVKVIHGGFRISVDYVRFYYRIKRTSGILWCPLKTTMLCLTWLTVFTLNISLYDRKVNFYTMCLPCLKVPVSSGVLFTNRYGQDVW